MCKLEGIKWCVIKSNKPISKNLSSKLCKIRFGSAQENTYSFYYFKDTDFENICSLLRKYKRLSFEVVRFYDKQLGLTINSWAGKEFKTDNLPLKHRFFWFNKEYNRQSVTPITTQQLNNIIKINS